MAARKDNVRASLVTRGMTLERGEWEEFAAFSYLVTRLRKTARLPALGFVKGVSSGGGT